MDQPRDRAPDAPEPTEDQSPQLVSRRRLLKILAAGGGAVIASTLLPETWSTPAVKAASDPYLSGLDVNCGIASFAYSDPIAAVDDDHTELETWIDGAADGWQSLGARKAAGLQRIGNGQNGTIRLPLWWTGNRSTHEFEVTMRIATTNSSWRYSNWVWCEYTDAEAQPCSSSSDRADVSAIIYGGWNGISVSASVGGTAQPALTTAPDASGRQAVLWTFYPPEGEVWTVVVTPQLPAGLDPARWKFEPASASATITPGSQEQVAFRLIDTGAEGLPQQ